MAIAANSPRSGSLGQGWGSLECDSLRARRPRGSGTRPRIPGLPPRGSRRRLGCCHRNTRCTHGTEIKHPSQTGPRRLGLPPRSPWQHAGSRAASDARGAARPGDTHSITGLRAAGCAAAGLAGAARSHLPEPGALAARRSARGGALSAPPPSPPAPSPPLEG